MTLALLPMLSSLSPGSLLTASPAAADQVWYQSVGRTSADAACERSSTTELAAGWTQWAPSWAKWVNKNTGGFVCNRQITWAYDSTSTSGSSSVTCTTTSGGTIVIPCAVGAYGPGGGIVFYDAGAQQSWGRYLEAAPNTWWSGPGDPGLQWSGNTSTTVSTSTDIGTGSANTTAIIVQDNTADRAATDARAYNGGEKTDWFLPSLDELNQLCRYAWGEPFNASATTCPGLDPPGTPPNGGFTAGDYWSSSQSVDTSSDAWNQSFDDDSQQTDDKTSELHVRPVRAF